MTLQCLLSISWRTPVDRAQGSSKNPKQTENTQPGCGWQDQTRNSKPETLPAPSYYQAVSTCSAHVQLTPLSAKTSHVDLFSRDVL